MQSRPLRDFERGAHLHVLDWAHQTARHRLQAAGAVQVKAAARAIAASPSPLAPRLPSLEAAVHGELAKLYALGHASVRSELDHQRSGDALPIGLSLDYREVIALDWHFDPDQPRDPNGEWSGGAGSRLGADLKALIDSSPQYREKTYRELLVIRDSMNKQLRAATADGNAERIAKWQSKVDVLSAHIEARKEAATHARRLAAQAEVKRTGALSVTKDEMREILGKPRDVYRDAELKPPFDYNPGLFKTSDLSGQQVRHYVVLPDGRIAHPDEFHEARKRGRIVVVDEVPLPPDAPHYLAAQGPRAYQLAVSDAPPGALAHLAARAHLIASDVAHQIHQAIHRARLQGITGRRTLRALGREAGHAALRAGASHHAGGAIFAGRHAAALDQSTQIAGARYTSVLDKNSCQPCIDADTGQLLALDDPGLVHPPNPACLGGDRCRCILVYQLRTEHTPAVIPEPVAVAAGG